MSWLLIALLAPVLFSVTNHIDKYLIGKYFRGHGGAGALIIFSSLVGVIVAPFILIIEQGVLNISFLQVLLLFVVAALTMLAILLYFYALQRDETSVVVPLFQLIPVFAFVLAYFVLGEILTFSQLGGASLVILGSVVISLTMEEKGRYCC
jgi:drug/metabolite transporter (DMT)-like permease